MAFIPKYILVLFLLIVIDYIMGRCIEKTKGNLRKYYMIMSIFANCLVLFFFKYFNFFSGNLTDLAQFLGWNYSIQKLEMILPIGLSFHTFQSLSYIFEIYKGRQKAEKHFGIYALYVMFYPQLVAGPIERPQKLIPQFYQEHYFEYQRVVDGLKLMAWGMFQKVIIADRLAVFTDRVYADPHGFPGALLMVSSVFFLFRVYCDFAGYSDIAIGAAQVMGFKLTKNFRQPFFSTTISEFWTRWHISLMNWFKDYLFTFILKYKSSFFSRRYRGYLALFVVFLTSGLWHGAMWTFIFWGAMQGFFIIFADLTKAQRKKIIHYIRLDKMPRILKLLQMGEVNLLSAVAAIAFASNSISDAFYINTHLFNNLFNFLAIKQSLVSIALSGRHLLQDVLLIMLLLLVHWFQIRTNGIRQWLNQKPLILRWSVYYGGIFVLLFWAEYGRNPFVYFQF